MHICAVPPGTSPEENEFAVRWRGECKFPVGAPPRAESSVVVVAEFMGPILSRHYDLRRVRQKELRRGRQLPPFERELRHIKEGANVLALPV